MIVVGIDREHAMQLSDNGDDGEDGEDVENSEHVERCWR